MGCTAWAKQCRAEPNEYQRNSKVILIKESRQYPQTMFVLCIGFA
jgi:hypothetical protein